MSENIRNLVCDICGGSDLHAQTWIDVNTGLEVSQWPDGEPWDGTAVCQGCGNEVQTVDAGDWDGPKADCDQCGDQWLKTELQEGVCPECRAEDAEEPERK